AQTVGDIRGRHESHRERHQPGADRLEQGRRGRGQQEEDRVDRGLLERLEKRDLRVLGEIRRVVDDDHPPVPLQRAEREVLLHLPDLLDRDELLVGVFLEVDQPCDQPDVGMGEMLDLAAGKADPAATGGAWLAGAEKGLRQPDGHRSLADRPRAAELIRMGHVALERFLAQTSEQATLPDHITHSGAKDSSWLAAGRLVGRAAVRGRAAGSGAAGLVHGVASFRARMYALAIAPSTPSRRVSRVISTSTSRNPASRSASVYSPIEIVPAMQPAHWSSERFTSAGSSARATMSATAKRPPGARTRCASRRTARLSAARLITQFEITTSTLASGSGICSIVPLRKVALVTAAF